MTLSRVQMEALVTPPYTCGTRPLRRDGRDPVWVIRFRRLDDKGRRCTRFIAEVYEHADAILITSLLNIHATPDLT